MRLLVSYHAPVALGLGLWRRRRMTARPPTWEELIGFGRALFARNGKERLCLACAGTARLYVLNDGEPLTCAACGAPILSVAMIERDGQKSS